MPSPIFSDIAVAPTARLGRPLNGAWEFAGRAGWAGALLALLALGLMGWSAAPAVAQTAGQTAAQTLAQTPTTTAAPGAAKPILNVVLIDGQDLGRPLLQQFQTELRRTLAERNGGRISMYLESADVSRFPGPDLSRDFDEWLQRKYANKRIDLVIAAANLPLERVLAWRSSVWKGAPLVIGLLDPAAAARLPAEPGISALLWRPEVDSTLELVRTLFPTTRRLLLVGGPAYGDLPGAWIRTQLEARGGMEVIDTGLRPVAELDAHVASLADDTVIFYSGVYSDSAGQGYQPQQVLESLSKRSSRPIVGLSPSYIGHGALGGGVIDLEAYARQAADLGMRLKDNPQLVVPAVPVSHGPQLTVDFRQLQRWNVAPHRLPPGTAVLNEPPSLWQEHRDTVITASIIGALLTLALIALLAASRSSPPRARPRAVARAATSSASAWSAASRSWLGR